MRMRVRVRQDRGSWSQSLFYSWCSCRCPVQPYVGCSPKTDIGKSARPTKTPSANPTESSDIGRCREQRNPSTLNAMRTRRPTHESEQRVVSAVNTRFQFGTRGKIRNYEMFTKSLWSQGKVVMAPRLLSSFAALNRVVGKLKRHSHRARVNPR